MATVLLVEDDPEIAHATHVILTSRGFEVVHAWNGEDALLILQTVTPFVILLDLAMPIMDGWETLAALRRDPRLAAIPVIAVTAYADDRLIGTKVLCTLSKPYAMEELLAVVRAVAPAEGAESVPLPRRRILAVDDEPANLRILVRTLSDSYDVVTADGKDAALALLDGHRIDLLVTDQTMPGGSGVELLTEVKRRAPRLPAMMITGYPDAPEVVGAHRAGLVQELIAKPWDRAEVRQLIHRLMERVAGGGVPASPSR